MEWVVGGSLKEAPWRTTYIVKTDLEVLARSLEDYGWLQPIIVQKSSNMIIDGHYRWEIASTISSLSKDTKKMVPVIYVDCDDIDAMLMHVRLNRGRGAPLAKRISRIVQMAIQSRKYAESHVKRILHMSYDEISLMVDGTLLKDKKISEHKYSSAWVPVESSISTKDAPMSIERPRNKDQ
jgi:ParB-like chromosome segregation protein Spo0J